MARDISIMISAKDNFTQAITTMRNANNSFNKDVTGLSQKLDELNKNKITLKIDTDKAKSALKEAEKQFISTGSAADKMSLEMASAKYDNAKRNLNLVSKNARKAEKDILNMTNAVSKADNRAGGIGKKSGIAGTVSTLAKAGLTKMLGDTATQVGNTMVSSAFGSETGTMFGSTLSGVATGAAMGSIIPGVGTAIGGAVGAGIGAINGVTKNFENEDNAFKSVVQESYNSLKQQENDTLTNGSSIASTREKDKISFTTMLGSKENSSKFLSDVTGFANKTPFEYDQLTKISKTMLAYGYKQKEILPELTKVGDAGSALGMSPEDMNFVATSLGRMRSTGKTTLEYLNPLLERGIDVWGYLSKASGKSKEQVQEMASKGLIPGAQAAKAISDYMGEAYKNSMNLQSNTFGGLKSTLEDAKNSLDAEMGNGFNEERKKGMRAQIDWFGGSNKSRMKNAYSMIGQWKASLKNEEEKAIRDAMNSAMNSDDYKKAAAQNNRVEMGKLLAKAQIDGENTYKKSDGYKLQLESDKSLASSIRESMKEDGIYKKYGYEMGIEFSKGLAQTAGPGIREATMPPKNILAKGAGGSFVTGADKGGGRDPKTGRLKNSAATGLFRVPYDNFPVLLHEGETVNTAVEARSARNSPTITITGNNITVREDADIDKIARALAEKIKRQALIS